MFPETRATAPARSRLELVTFEDGPRPDDAPSRRRPLLLAALLFAVTLATFQAVCRHPFVEWDDSLHTYHNQFLPLTLSHLARCWRAPYDGEYIPVSYVVYMLLARIALLRVPVPTPSNDMLTALNPHVFHTANLILHLLNTLLVFSLLRRILPRFGGARHDAAAFGGALLFAIHPVQVESVAWISEMRGLLSGFFGLLALTWYLDFAERSGAGQPGGRVCYVLALAAFLLALLSKPSAVAVPLLACLLDVGVARRPLRATLPALAVWLCAAAPIVWLTHDSQPLPTVLVTALWQRPLVAADALTFYLAKLLLPLQLAIVYGRTPMAVLHGRLVWLTCLVPVLAGVLAWRLRGRVPVLTLALGLFTAAVLPVLGFIPFQFQIYSTVGDRYLYLALLGPALLVSWVLSQAAGRRVWIGYGLFLTLCFVQSVRQVTVWRDSETLFKHTLAVYPDDAMMHFNLGNIEYMNGWPVAAVAQYRESIRLKPEFPGVHSNLGAVLLAQGQRAEAWAQLKEAVRLQPGEASAHTMLGLILSDAGDERGAVREWRAAITYDPSNPVARDCLQHAFTRKTLTALVRH